MSAEVPDPSAGLADARQASGRESLRHRRWVYRVAVAVVSLVVGLSLLDGLSDGVALVGVDRSRATAAGPGVVLTVWYPEVARPGLSAPLHVEVARTDGGFDADIELALPEAYLGLWDANGLFPEPKEWRSEGEEIVFVFERPSGARFRFSYDARIEPGVQWGRSAHVSVLEGGRPAATARFRTKVLP